MLGHLEPPINVNYILRCDVDNKSSYSIQTGDLEERIFFCASYLPTKGLIYFHDIFKDFFKGHTGPVFVLFFLL